MSFYQLNLGLLAAANLLLLHRQYVRRRRDHDDKSKDEIDGNVESQQLLSPPAELAGTAKRFQLEYFTVYAFAVGADWLQVSSVAMIPIIDVRN